VPDLDSLIEDLAAESAELDVIVTDPAVLRAPTPAAGWTVGDTMGHLWFFDREATLALAAPDRFIAGLDAIMADPDGYFATSLDAARALGDELLATWREQRQLMVGAARRTDPSVRVPWYGPPMSPLSFLTARLMETWAHGQDIVDGLGIDRVPTDRLRHVAHLGVRTRQFSSSVRGEQPRPEPVHVALTSPSGESWTWDDPAASDRIEGSALDFCLLVTQRRHRDQLDLTVTGEAAEQWMSNAQVFAGKPTTVDPARRSLTTR
jgi:uncharacterized protein (TIGR03084 family)